MPEFADAVDALWREASNYYHFAVVRTHAYLQCQRPGRLMDAYAAQVRDHLCWYFSMGDSPEIS